MQEYDTFTAFLDPDKLGSGLRGAACNDAQGQGYCQNRVVYKSGHGWILPDLAEFRTPTRKLRIALSPLS